VICFYTITILQDLHVHATKSRLFPTFLSLSILYTNPFDVEFVIGIIYCVLTKVWSMLGFTDEGGDASAMSSRGVRVRVL
jgi:hypothetical protein